jgi:biopolymer transport protein ExbD
MAFSSQDQDDGDMLSEINMIPLIDVMLVLLIVFMITVPVMKHAVDVALPRASSQISQDKPDTIKLSISSDGQYYWNDSLIDEPDLDRLLTQAASTKPQPPVHIRGDKSVRYEHVAHAMATAQRAGIKQLGFVTEP